MLGLLVSHGQGGLRSSVVTPRLVDDDAAVAQNVDLSTDLEFDRVDDGSNEVTEDEKKS